MTISTLHPPITDVKVIDDHRVDGGKLISTGGVVTLLKAGETPQARRIYRLYLAEYRALEGQPLQPERRESTALMAAFRRAGLGVVEASLGDA